jgi:NTP pyrophosphatase (non-canonical NTP hydrolase)
MNKSTQLKYDRICIEAITLFGIANQSEMLVEECAESIMAVQKLKRAEEITYKNILSQNNLISRQDNFAEEIADVKIMINQFYLTDINLKHKVDFYCDTYEPSSVVFKGINTKEIKKILSEELIINCSKLITLIQKIKLLDNSEYFKSLFKNDFAIDIADLKNTIEHLYALDKDLRKSIDSYYKSKIERLDGRIKDYKKRLKTIKK